jgi:hypothetical protein
MKKTPVLVLVFLVGLVGLINNAKAEDGTFDAVVTTNSGSYTVPVEVEDGEVTHVYWSNGGAMSVDGAELDDNEASGTNSRGEPVSIEIDDSSYEPEY